MAFEGFTRAGISFLKALAANNNKSWFAQNRDVYEKHVLNPLKLLAADLGPVVKSIDPDIVTTPAVNKTISNIHRDTRFANDKSPFRTELWISFKRPRKIRANVPELFFYFTPEEYHYGAGYFAATPDNMEKFRRSIAAHPGRFKKIVDFYDSQSAFTLVGAEYKKRIPSLLPAEFQRWFQKRSVCLSRIKKLDKTFFSGALKKEIEDAFKLNAAFYRFLIDSIL